MVRILGLIGWCMLALGAPAAAADRPRILSINPCVDAILMQVADPAQIAAISHYSRNPEATSISIGQARRFRVTAGTAEEILMIAPDLVLADVTMTPSTRAALQRVNIRVVTTIMPESIAESMAQVQEIARLAGHPARGKALAARMAAAMRAARPATARRPSALLWQTTGLVLGPGTLSNDLLIRSGFSNAAAGYGFGTWGALPLELLIARPPAVLLAGTGAEAGTGQPPHPALRRLTRHIAVRDFPFALLRCGGPMVIPALHKLAEIRRTLP